MSQRSPSLLVPIGHEFIVYFLKTLGLVLNAGCRVCHIDGDELYGKKI